MNQKTKTACTQYNGKGYFTEEESKMTTDNMKKIPNHISNHAG